MKRLTQPEWFELGQQLFGDDIKAWRVVCPNCGTVQTIQDLLDAGVDRDRVEGQFAFSCVGRHKEGVGCDWTLGGLFQIHKLEVECEGGHIRPCFEFEGA